MNFPTTKTLRNTSSTGTESDAQQASKIEVQGPVGGAPVVMCIGTGRPTPCTCLIHVIAQEPGQVVRNKFPWKKASLCRMKVNLKILKIAGSILETR